MQTVSTKQSGCGDYWAFFWNCSSRSHSWRGGKKNRYGQHTQWFVRRPQGFGRSQHEYVVNEVPAALLHQDHLSNIVAGRGGKLFPPHNGDGAGPAED